VPQQLFLAGDPKRALLTARDIAALAKIVCFSFALVNKSGDLRNASEEIVAEGRDRRLIGISEMGHRVWHPLSIATDAKPMRAVRRKRYASGAESAEMRRIRFTRYFALF